MLDYRRASAAAHFKKETDLSCHSAVMLKFKYLYYTSNIEPNFKVMVLDFIFRLTRDLFVTDGILFNHEHKEVGGCKLLGSLLKHFTVLL